MRLLLFSIFVLVSGCGSDFQVPPPPDARISLDLGVSVNPAPPDMACFNMACGGCSAWANYDGTPAKVGDPCLWKGTYQCTGTTLKCSDASCPQCPSTMTGSVCGADHHTILELTNTGTCQVYDFGSAIDVCNHGPSDKCVGRCTMNTGGTYSCEAHCVSDDGGGTGCEYNSTATCQTLAGC